jgi:Na+/alanine symporter
MKFRVAFPKTEVLGTASLNLVENRAFAGFSRSLVQNQPGFGTGAIVKAGKVEV